MRPPRLDVDGLQDLAAFYQTHGYQDDDPRAPKNVGSGFYKPTNIPILDLEMKNVYIEAAARDLKGKLDLQGPAFVPGVGDGRRATYLHKLGFSPVVGVDLNPELVAYANELKQEAGKQGIVNPDQIHYFHGDFLDDEVLEEHDMKFSDFGFISSYLLKPNLRNLASRVRDESKPGTILSSLSPVDWDVSQPGFDAYSRGVDVQGYTYRDLTFHRKV